MDVIKYKCLCCCFKEDPEKKKEKKPKRKQEEWEKCFGHDRETGSRTCCWETPYEWGIDHFFDILESHNSYLDLNSRSLNLEILLFLTF